MVFRECLPSTSELVNQRLFVFAARLSGRRALTSRRRSRRCRSENDGVKACVGPCHKARDIKSGKCEQRNSSKGRRMSQLGQTRSSTGTQAESALPPKADIP